MSKFRKQYKRPLTIIEEYGILLGDELPEECNWGRKGEDIRAMKKNPGPVVFIEMSRKYIYMENNIRTFGKYGRKNDITGNLLFLLRSFFYYDAQEDL